jgi:hypothetical protein
VIEEQNKPMVPEQSEPMEPQGAIQENEQASNSVEGEFVNQQAEIGPAQQAQIDAYSDNATIAVFSEESQPGILQMLQSDKEPIASVANTAFAVHKQLETMLVGTGEKMTEVTMALGAAHLVSELIVLAEAANLYTLTSEQRLEAYRHSVMKYFETGLKDGSIDPVELQKTIEPLMTDEQRQYGLEQMEQSGISKTQPPSGMGNKPQAPQQGILGR